MTALTPKGDNEKGCVMNNIIHGVAIMREFHSKEGLDANTHRMLSCLGDTAEATLSNQNLSEHERKNFLMVILRSACQIGKGANG
jgi:hypothetical protein